MQGPALAGGTYNDRDRKSGCLDIGTGLVKCVSDHGVVRCPSPYVRRTHDDWAAAFSAKCRGEITVI